MQHNFQKKNDIDIPDSYNHSIVKDKYLRVAAANTTTSFCSSAISAKAYKQYSGQTIDFNHNIADLGFDKANVNDNSNNHNTASYCQIAQQAKPVQSLDFNQFMNSQQDSWCDPYASSQKPEENQQPSTTMMCESPEQKQMFSQLSTSEALQLYKQLSSITKGQREREMKLMQQSQQQQQLAQKVKEEAASDGAQGRFMLSPEDKGLIQSLGIKIESFNQDNHKTKSDIQLLTNGSKSVVEFQNRVSDFLKNQNLEGHQTQQQQIVITKLKGSHHQFDTSQKQHPQQKPNDLLPFGQPIPQYQVKTESFEKTGLNLKKCPEETKNEYQDQDDQSQNDFDEDSESSNCSSYSIDVSTAYSRQKSTSIKTNKRIQKLKKEPMPTMSRMQSCPVQQAATNSGGGFSKFHCVICNEDFETGQALGGHMSRVHPGTSTAYSWKMQRREERRFDRELLRLAKIRHDQEKGVDAPLDRVYIRKQKKQLRAQILQGKKVEGYQKHIKPKFI